MLGDVGRTVRHHEKLKSMIESPRRPAPAIASVAAALALAACSSDDSTGAGDGGPSEPAGAGALLEAATIPVPDALPAAAEARRLDYAMDAVGGGTTTARAQLFAPAGTAPAGGFPLVVWAHGTTGIANACTPSASFEDFGNAVAVGGLLEAGYAVLLPDYEGFGQPSIHPYYVRSSHANSVLDAVPAAHALDDVELGDDWALVGHSQGGHAALAAARAEPDPAHPLRAVVALAPGTDLAAFSDLAFEAIDRDLAEGNLALAAERTFYLNVYGAFVAHSARLVEPTFEPASLFGESIAPLIDEALDEAECGDYARAVNEALVAHLETGATLAEFGGLRRDWYDDAVLAARLDDERFGDEAQSMPLLVVQGDADRQVPLAATTGFVDAQRALGTDVTYELVEGGRHGDPARAEFGRTLAWLAERFPAR